MPLRIVPQRQRSRRPPTAAASTASRPCPPRTVPAVPHRPSSASAPRRSPPPRSAAALLLLGRRPVLARSVPSGPSARYTLTVAPASDSFFFSFRAFSLGRSYLPVLFYSCLPLFISHLCAPPSPAARSSAHLPRSLLSTAARLSAGQHCAGNSRHLTRSSPRQPPSTNTSAHPRPCNHWLPSTEGSRRSEAQAPDPSKHQRD